MEINEKLDIFYRAAIEAANGQSEEILEDYKAAYRESLTEYEKKKQDGQQTRMRIAEEKVRRELNREVSGQMVRLKKEYHDSQAMRKNELFAMVEEALLSYRRTAEYEDYLIRKTKEAKELAHGREVIVYLDPLDADRRQRLEEQSGCKLEISGEAFGGGIRAVIPSANLLMDESFDSKLADERERFSF